MVEGYSLQLIIALGENNSTVHPAEKVAYLETFWTVMPLYMSPMHLVLVPDLWRIVGHDVRASRTTGLPLPVSLVPDGEFSGEPSLEPTFPLLMNPFQTMAVQMYLQTDDL